MVSFSHKIFHIVGSIKRCVMEEFIQHNEIYLTEHTKRYIEIIQYNKILRFIFSYIIAFYTWHQNLF